MTLGTRLKYRREELGLSGPELADEVGASRQYINQIENGVIQDPGARLLLKLAERLGVRERWLMTGEEPIETMTAAEVRQFARFKDLLSGKQQSESDGQSSIPLEHRYGGGRRQPTEPQTGSPEKRSKK